MEHLEIRKATIGDLMLYFNWANDVSVRQNAINREPILLKNHKKWFGSRVTSETTFLYVFEQAGIPVGQVRFDIYDDTAEIDYSIDKKFRGHGFGKEILILGIENLINKLGSELNEIVGIVKEDNLASLKVFEALSFERKGNREIESEKYIALSFSKKILKLGSFKNKI